MLAKYSALSASSNRTDVQGVLSSIVNALPLSLATQDRYKLVQLLLDDVKRCDEIGGQGRLTKKDARQALLALKTLGREPGCSRILSSESNFRILLAAETSLRSSDPDAADEALRCVANALLLVDSARNTWANIGGVYCVELLEQTTSTNTVFLVCRILFLSTASSSAPFLRRLLDEFSEGPIICADHKDIVAIISSKLDILLPSVLKSETMSKEAFIDLLKFAFNLLCHWPRMADDVEDTRGGGNVLGKESKTSLFGEERAVLGDKWTRRLDKILPSLRRAYIGLPPCSPSPLSAPMTHILHALLPIPIIDRLHAVWFPEGLDDCKRRASFFSWGTLSLHTTTTASTSESGGHSPSSESGNVPKGQETQGSSRSGSPSATGSSKGKEKERESRGALDRALSMLNTRMSLSRSPSPASPGSSKRKNADSPGGAPEVLRRSVELLDATLKHYLPGNIDPDDASVKQTCSIEDVQLDHVLSPLVLLLTRFCKHSLECRKSFRQFILPPNMDRSTPLETRPNMLGRCIRLMACISHTQLKEAVGELLFVTCDSDAQVLSGQIGYGNAAGFLFNRGILSAPPTESSGATDSVNPSVNPITGTIQQERDTGPEMTDEEKEREAEKLFVLFERLEKSGAMENPLRKALHEGKLEKYRDRGGKDESDDD